MPMGSVIVDLAVEAGGNCEYSKLGEVVSTSRGVKIIGHRNVSGRLAQDASALFARNLLNFITPQVNKEKEILEIDWEDEVIKGTLITKGGKIVNESINNKIDAFRPKKKKSS